MISCSSCSSLVGFESCINGWFGHDFSKTCPNCRTPRGLTKSFALKDFNDLIAQANVLNASVPNPGAFDDAQQLTSNQYTINNKNQLREDL